MYRNLYVYIPQEYKCTFLHVMLMVLYVYILQITYELVLFWEIRDKQLFFFCTLDYQTTLSEMCDSQKTTKNCTSKMVF